MASWMPEKPLLSIKRKRNCGVLLTVAGLVLWFCLVLSTRVWWIDPQNSFGLLQVLPIWFWIALVIELAGIFLTIKDKHIVLFIIQIIFLNLIILGTAVFVEPNARVNDTWGNFGTASTIIDSGRITIIDSFAYWFLQYPATFTFAAIFVEISAIPQPLFLQIFPLVSSTFFLLGFYAWTRKLLSNQISQKLCMVLLLLLNLWLRFHFDPQAIGLVLLPIALFASLKENRQWRIVTLLLSIMLIIFHPVTAAFLILLLFAQNILLWFKCRKLNYTIPLLLLIVWIAWLYFYATIYFERWVVERILQNLLNPSLFSSTVFTELGKHYIIPSLMRLTLFAVTSLFAVWAIWRIRKKPRSPYFLYLAWLVSTAVIGVLDIFVYQAEFSDRFFAFSTLLFPILIAEFIWGLKNNLRKRLVVFFVVIGIVNLTTLYYYENYWIVSDSTLTSAAFVTSSAYSQTIYGHRLNILNYYNVDIDQRDVHLFWSPNDQLANASIAIYDDYSAMSKYGPKLGELANMYFGKTNDVKIYDNGHVIVHKIILP